MIECENFVEVTINGPKDQVDIYVDWLSTTAECIFGMKFNSHIPKESLVLTHDSNADTLWKFMSSNIKRKIRSYKHKKTNTIDFRINYLVYYGEHQLENGDYMTIDIKDYTDGIYQELVDLFTPIPPHIKKRCPQLNATIRWGSYYIQYNYAGIDTESFMTI